MPLKRLDQARPFFVLGLVVVTWLIVPVAIKTFTRASFLELQAPVAIATSYAGDLQEYWSLRMHSNHELIEKGRDAAHAAASYAFAMQQYAELQTQVVRLENLLKMPSFREYRAEHARVIRRDFSGFWQQLVIRKGRNFKITIDSPDIFSGGVVGRVMEVRATTSVVEVISSPSFRIPAVIEGDTRPMSFQGGSFPAFGPPIAFVEHVPLDITTSKPQRLVTWGGSYPAGLTLGEITDLKMGADGLFKIGQVKLEERLASLTEVTVLVPLTQE